MHYIYLIRSLLLNKKIYKRDLFKVSSFIHKGELERVQLRLKRGFFYIMIMLIIFLAIYLKNQIPSTVQITQNNFSQTNAEDIAQKLQSTQLTKKIILALRAEGYQPDSTVEYLIDSSDNQIITIHLHDLEKLDNRTESKIQKIVTNIAQKNSFDLFIVDVQLTNNE